MLDISFFWGVVGEGSYRKRNFGHSFFYWSKVWDENECWTFPFFGIVGEGSYRKRNFGHSFFYGSEGVG